MKISDLPIIDMTKETEFEKWWAHANENSSCEKRAAKWVWECAWTAATLGQLDRAKAEERAEIERRLLAMAGQAFVANKDDHAHWFRSLVNVLFKNRDDSKKPGDTSGETSS